MHGTSEHEGQTRRTPHKTLEFVGHVCRINVHVFETHTKAYLGYG